MSINTVKILVILFKLTCLKGEYIITMSSKFTDKIMLADSLVEFGLNQKEANVYLALLELGESKVHDIAHKSQITRPTTYDILEKLAKQGLVGAYDKHNIRHYVASDPEKIRRTLVEKQQAFESLLPELKSIHNTLRSKPKISFFEGVSGIKTVFEDTLTAKNKTLRGILSMADLYKIPGKKYMDDYVARRVASSFNLRVVRSKPKEIANDWLAGREENRDVRFPPANMVFEMTTYIYDNKVGLISTIKENFGMIIESQEYSNNMGHMFEALWQISKPS